jgi:hypothetical protein
MIAANNLEGLVKAAIMICLPIDFAPRKMLTVVSEVRYFRWNRHGIGPAGQPRRKPPLAWSAI